MNMIKWVVRSLEIHCHDEFEVIPYKILFMAVNSKCMRCIKRFYITRVRKKQHPYSNIIIYDFNLYPDLGSKRLHCNMNCYQKSFSVEK